MWAYTHVPHLVKADAGPDGITGAWDERERAAMADRLEDAVERLAPGFRATILTAASPPRPRSRSTTPTCAAAR